MKINKFLLAALGIVAGAAHAEVEVLNNDKGKVEIYGILDASVGHVQHSLSVDPQFAPSVNPVTPVKNDGKTPSSVTGVLNGSMQDSRLGFKGGADIGDGMKVFFILEEGFNLPTAKVNNNAAAMASNGGTATTASASSSLDGQLFNRQAFVGVSDEKWGSLAIGRNYAPMYPLVKVYDAVVSDLFSPIGFSGSYGGGGGISENARVDGSLKYTNKAGPYNFGALYKFGGSSLGGSAGSGFTMDGEYAEGNFGIRAAYQRFIDAQRGTPSKLTPNAIDVIVVDTKAFMIAAKYNFGAATAKMGYETYTLSAPSDPLALSAMSYYGQTVAAGSNNFTTGGVTNAPQTTHIVWIGGDYNFTAKLNLAVGYYDIHLLQSDDLVQKNGDQRYLSAVADYNITKTLDSYAGIMYSTYSGAQFPSSGSSAVYQSNNVVGLGMRYKF